jgi:prolipoprotein diacylglyceryltransferase
VPPVASIPLPGRVAWSFGPATIRAYAVCVLAGIVVALVVASRRYRKLTGQRTSLRAGQRGVILDVAAWAIPFGLAGAFVHGLLEATRHEFRHHPGLWRVTTEAVAAIGVPGAIALGALGAWIACRRAGIPLGPVAGAAAPAVAFGLAVGELAHWWAQDFYGRPASWWLAERIAPQHRVGGYENYPTFQPAFLYQSVWDMAVGFAVIWAARRFALTGERTFMLAAAAYAVGGLWVESVRIGPQARVLGMPYAAWGDLGVLVVAALVLYLTRRRKVPPRRPVRVPLAGNSAVM